MEKRTRLLRALRSIPYALAILISIIFLYEGLGDVLTPIQGTYHYESLFYFFMLFLLVVSVFAKRTLKTVLVLISCNSLFSTGLVILFKRLRDSPIRPPDGGPIYMHVWIEIAFVGLLFTVVVIEAAMLIRARTDQT